MREYKIVLTKAAKKSLEQIDELKVTIFRIMFASQDYTRFLK